MTKPVCSIHNEIQEIYEVTGLTVEDVSELWECFLGLTAFDYGQLRFGNNEDGTWYDRKKCDNIPASEVIRRGVEQLTETIRLSL